jgi:hypothetical protein
VRRRDDVVTGERRSSTERGLVASVVVGSIAAIWAVAATWLARSRADDRAAATPAPTPAETATVPDERSSSEPTPRSQDGDTFGFLWNVGRILVPTGFVVALAYYFGWARTRKLYRELGVDHSLLGFSTDDYALRSLGVLVTPLPVVAGYVLVLALLYVSARWWFERGDASQLRWKTGSVLAVVILVSAWTFLDGWNDGDWTDTIAFLVISAAIAILPAQLAARRDAARDGDHTDRQDRRSSVVAVNLLALALAVLFAFAAFEVVRQHALDEGVEAALAAEAHPDRFACVVLLSARPIGLIEFDGEPVISGETAFYRYGGLRIFTRSSGRLFVWPSDRSPREGLLVINEQDVVAARLVPQRRFGACPRPATS